MNFEGFKYMSLCNKAGIRIYPVPKYGSYCLEIEFNSTSEFHYKDIKGKPKQGTERYDPKGTVWQEKIFELYEHLYKTKVESKSEAA